MVLFYKERIELIKEVIKADGSVEPFDLEKLSKWAKYASKVGGDWTTLAIQTFSRLPERVHSKDIHQTMIDVCYLEENIENSRVAARLELAQLRKNMERQFGVLPNKETFKNLRNILLESGVWCKEAIPEYSEKQEDLYQELKEVRLEAWQIGQWDDKYLLKIDGLSVEIPALAAMGIGLGLHGNTKDALDLASDIIYGRTNLPTPVLNGVRNGDFDGVSCCVISGGDTVESIGVAEHIAMRMTAKKAGIGIEYTTRSKGSSVKGGATKHLGKHSIYKSLDGAVKMFTQVTRGGSATVSFNVIDPEVEDIALWKSQRVDIEQRLDKLDYSFCFNDAFLDAVVKKQDWYLFDYQDAPKVWDMFYKGSIDEYNEVVTDHINRGVPHKKVKALDLIKHLLIIRQETGRMYCFNVSRANTHTPFIDVIKLSNLCQEICLPTKPYTNMEDLYNDNTLRFGGETAFCSLGALVPVNVKSYKEYERVAYTLVKSVNKLIEKCPKMTKNHERTMLERRSLGIGITGLAEYLYQNNYDYNGDEDSLEFVHDLAEKHMFYCYKASIQLSKETGIEVNGIDNDWLPIDTKISKYSTKQDWESIRGLPRMNSVLIAHMPTESSAVASGVLNGLYPARRKVINKKSRKGVVQFICDSFNPEVHLSAYDVPNITLSRYYGVVQDWSDQGISADTYFRPSAYVDEKKPMTELLKEWVAHFRLGNKSMYYVNTEDTSGGSIHDVLKNLQAAEDEACEGCTL